VLPIPLVELERQGGIFTDMNQCEWFKVGHVKRIEPLITMQEQVNGKQSTAFPVGPSRGVLDISAIEQTGTASIMSSDPCAAS
jgi:hypothetical protein